MVPGTLFSSMRTVRSEVNGGLMGVLAALHGTVDTNQITPNANRYNFPFICFST